MSVCTTCPFQSLGNDLITNVNLPPIPVDSKRKGQNIAGSSNPKTMKTQNATSQINPSTSAQSSSTSSSSTALRTVRKAGLINKCFSSVFLPKNISTKRTSF